MGYGVAKSDRMISWTLCKFWHYLWQLLMQLFNFSPEASRKFWCLGKPPWNCLQVQMVIARIAIAPPPFRQPGTLGHFIFGPNWATLSNHRVDGYKCPKPSWQAFWTPPQSSNYPFELQFSLHKCPKPSWQAFWPPHNQANCPFGLGHLSAPNHPGKRWDPPPHLGNAHLNLETILVGPPLGKA